MLKILSLFSPAFPPAMLYPDEPLPSSQMSLRQFSSRAKKLYELGIGNTEADPDYGRTEAMLPFLRFVLAGRMTVGDLLPEEYDHEFGETKRVVVNAMEENVHDEITDYTLRRDFDSLIGLSKTLPFSTCFYVYPVPDFKLTMTRRNWNHLFHRMTLPGVSDKRSGLPAQY